VQVDVVLEELPGHDPAFVLRSQYVLVRALLAIATIAVAALSVAVVILASAGHDGDLATAGQPMAHIDYGGFNPGTGRPDTAPLP
jgi:hypothetical protein